MLKEITKFIDAKALGPPWQNGINLFAGHVPVKNITGTNVPDRYMAILENAGGATVPDLPDRADKAIQFLNRAKTYFTARDDAQEIYDNLHGYTGWIFQIGVGHRYYAMIIDAMSVPAPIENPGERGLFTFSTNYLFRIRDD